MFPFTTYPLNVFERSNLKAPWLLMDDTEYEIAPGRRGLYSLNGVWWQAPRTLRVSYYEGFTSTPGDVKQLVLDLVSAYWARFKAGAYSPMVTSETIGNYSYSTGGSGEIKVSESPLYAGTKSRWRRMLI